MTTSSAAWELWDTGALSAAQNVALDRSLLAWRAENRTPNILRFLQFDPPAVLVGYHQAVAQEVRLDYCRENAIEINRRVTGGGAVFFDHSQLGWELVFDRRDGFDHRDIDRAGPSPGPIFERIMRGFIRGLGLLGVEAELRGRNDIAVRGRKIAGTGGTGDGHAMLFQGTLLVDFDVEAMLRALRVPVEKLASKELDCAKKRVICLEQILGEAPPLAQIKRCLIAGFEAELGIEINSTGGSYPDPQQYERVLQETRSASWIDQVRAPAKNKPLLAGASTSVGGKVSVYLKIDLERSHLEEALFIGDFFSLSPRAVYDLEASLRRAPLAELETRIEKYFAEHAAQFHQVDANPFAQALGDALARLRSVRYGLSTAEANSLFTVGKSFIDIETVDQLLIPYCSKKVSCHYRQEKDCSSCGECEVGEIYSLAKECDTDVETIVNFEDLMQTLRRLRAAGKSAFLGSCCQPFFLKHRQELEQVGLPGILVDMAAMTCFDLRVETRAYAGQFERHVPMNIQLFTKLMRTKCRQLSAFSGQLETRS